MAQLGVKTLPKPSSLKRRYVALAGICAFGVLVFVLNGVQGAEFGAETRTHRSTARQVRTILRTRAHETGSSNALADPVAAVVRPAAARVPPISDAGAGPSRQVIFTVSPGYSGTVFLAQALRCGGLDAEHEPEPSYMEVGEVAALGHPETYGFRRRHKLDALLQRLAAVPLNTTYADVSNTFYKSWSDVALDYMTAHNRLVRCQRHVARRRSGTQQFGSNNTTAAQGRGGHAEGNGPATSTLVHYTGALQLPQEVVDCVRELKAAEPAVRRTDAAAESPGVNADGGSADISVRIEPPKAPDTASDEGPAQRFDVDATDGADVGMPTCPAYKGSYTEGMTTQLEVRQRVEKESAALCRSGLEHVADAGVTYNVTILVLRRYLPDMLRSTLSRDYWRITDPKEVLMYRGSEYQLYSPHLARLRPLGPFERASAVQRAIGYLADFEAQVAALKARYPPQAGSLRYVDVRLEGLSSIPAVGAFLASASGLGVPAQQVSEKCVKRLVNTPKPNSHQGWRAPNLTRVPEQVWLAHLQSFIQAYEAAGTPLPPLPGLHRVGPGPCSASLLAAGFNASEFAKLPASRISAADAARLSLSAAHDVDAVGGEAEVPSSEQLARILAEAGHTADADAIRAGVWCARRHDPLSAAALEAALAASEPLLAEILPPISKPGRG